MEEILTGEKITASNRFIVGSVPTVFYIPEYVSAAEEDQLLKNIYETPISKWKSLKNRRLQNWGGVVHEKGLLAQDFSAVAIGCCQTPEKLVRWLSYNLPRENKFFVQALGGYHICDCLKAKNRNYDNLVQKLKNYAAPSSRRYLHVPSWLKKVTNRISKESGLFPSAINHVLINEYLPDQGIMPHQDGPAYMPVVAILSLGSPVVMDFVPHPNLENTVDTSGNNNEDIISKPSHMEMSSGESFSKHRPFSVVLMPRSLLIFKDMAYSDYLHGIQDSENQPYDEAVNIINYPNSDGQAETFSGLKIDGEAGGDRVIYRTTTRVSLTCRLVTKVHKHLIKL